MHETVNLGQYAENETDATIIEVNKRILRNQLGENVDIFREKMRLPDRKRMTQEEIEDYKDTRLDSEVLVIKYRMIDGTEREQFYTIPKISGWGKSNIRLLMLKNDLPPETDEWVGQVIKVTINKEGYPEIAK